jgi:hypothetical protein
MPVQRETTPAIWLSVTASLAEGRGLLLLDRLQLLLQLRDHAIGELAGAGEVALALCLLKLDACLVQLFLEAGGPP